MICGIGSDVFEVARMAASLERRGPALAQRLLAAPEWREYQRHASPHRFLAKRFAAKEAVLKALGTGLREGIRWRDIHIDHDSRGKPEVVLDGAAREQLERLSGARVWLSISDERHYVLAFAIIEAS